MALIIGIFAGLYMIAFIGLSAIILNEYEGVARLGQYIWGSMFLLGGLFGMFVFARGLWRYNR